MELVDVAGVKINLSNKPIAPQGLEQSAQQLVDEINLTTLQDRSDDLLLEFIGLRDKGVLFQPRLMFDCAKSHSNRIPSISVVCKHIPGANEIYLDIVNEWPKINQSNYLTVFRRFIMNLYLSSSVKTLATIEPDIFKTIVNTYKDNEGYWLPEVTGKSDRVALILTAVAKSLTRLRGEPKYLAYTKQPRSRFKRNAKGVQAVGPDFIINNPTPETTKWVEVFSKWLKTLSVKNTKPHKTALGAMLNWVKNYPPEIANDPLRFLSAYRGTPTLLEHFNSLEDVKEHDLRIISYVANWTEWIIDEYLTEFDEDGVVRVGFSVLSSRELRQLDGVWVDPPRHQTSSRPLPTEWILKVKDILTKDDYAWPKSLPNQRFAWKNPESGELEDVWCPVLTSLFETLLELPLRRIQVLCLDSGEGDALVYDHRKKQWIDNPAPTAGYWQRDPSARVKQRGVVQKMGSPGKEIVGFHINTNKTAERHSKGTELEGYDIPWENTEVIRVLNSLREWQQKYNPLSAPTPFDQVYKTFGYTPTEKIVAGTPDRFYMFRTPLSNDGVTPWLPPSTNQVTKFWALLMEKLEEVLRDEGEEHQIILSRNKVTGQPETPFYNIHGLRVATLTAFSENGAPIEVLSKLIAGHSTILMTIYYLKYDAVSVSELITDTASKMKSAAGVQLRRHLESKTWEEAKKIAVYNDEAVFESVMKSQFYPSWLDLGYGVCPNGGAHCDTGGECIKGSATVKDRKYAPAKGRYKCLECRHFITGAPFLIQMWMLANKLLLEAQGLATEYDKNDDEVKLLKRNKYEAHKSGDTRLFTNLDGARLSQLNGQCDLQYKQLNDTLLLVHSSTRKIDRIAHLMEHNKDNENLSVLTVSDQFDFEKAYREAGRFEVLSHICQASRVYPFLEDKDIEMEREQFIDTLMIRENLYPLRMQPLTEEQKRQALDAASQFLIHKVGVDEAQAVHDGRKTLTELGLRTDFTKTLGSIAAPLQMAAPVPRIGSAANG